MNNKMLAVFLFVISLIPMVFFRGIDQTGSFFIMMFAVMVFFADAKKKKKVQKKAVKRI